MSERLEEIKELWKKGYPRTIDDEYGPSQYDKDFEWLISRVEELEGELEAAERQEEQWKELIRTAMTWKDIYEKESKRYKQALEKVKKLTRHDDGTEEEVYNTVTEVLEQENE